MKPRRRASRSLASLAATVLLSGSPALAAEDEWEFAVFTYLWASGVSGSIETATRNVDFESSFSDIVKELDFAAMASFEARKGDWGIITDFIYTNISSSSATPGVFFTKADVEMRSIIGTGYLAYRAFENDTVSFDALAAFRVWWLDTTAKLKDGVIPDEKLEFSDTWVDPVIGARVIVNIDENWSVTGLGDVGGFGVGSDLAWQLYGSVNYSFNETWSAHVGYRYLSVKRDFGNATLEEAYYGPMLGVALRF